LDRCGADNGPLRVLAGSHQSGRLEDEFDSWKQRTVEYQCEPPLGGVVAMRPLLLHASSPAEAPSHRRVLHFEYARHSLPGGLEWRDQIGAIDQAED
jgi:ectoine hydroxylase-related dioxygenase (phytanoyl-CoA dioxygenase family)